MTDEVVAGPVNAKRQRCEVYSRVVGYLRPISNWNKGKKAEFADRKTYDPRQSTEGVSAWNGSGRPVRLSR